MGLRSNDLTYSSCLEALQPLERAKLALPNMLLTLSDDEPALPTLRLTGVDCTLPSEEEQLRKKETALARLSAYTQLCGGRLDKGWTCAVRCRLTTRRNGRLGVTTDNYYYSPTGQTFRSHKQVAKFLGLSEPQEPLSSSDVTVSSVRAPHPGPQPLSSTSLSAVSTDSHLSSNNNNSMLKRPAGFAISPEPQHTAKRPRAEHAAAATCPINAAGLGAPSNRTPVPSFDLSFAAQAARSAASHHAALAAQAALMGSLPAPVPPHSAAVAVPQPCNTPLCEQQPQQQLQVEQRLVQDVQEPAAAVAQPASIAMPPPPQPPAKRTKALLASKYKASNSNSTLAGNSVVAVAAGSGSSSTSTCKPTTSNPCSAVTSSIGVLSRSLSRQGLQQVPVCHQQQSEQQHVQRNQQQIVHTTPAVSASSSKCTLVSAAAVAMSTSACTASSPPKQRQHIKQHKPKELKPVHKQQPPGSYKAKPQPAWRANLRVLASQFAANTANSGPIAASKIGTALNAADTANEQ